MTAAFAPNFVVTEDELQILARRVGIQTLPCVMGVRLRHSTGPAYTAAVDPATRSLAHRGLISDGEVAHPIAPILRALQRPNRELAMRLVTPDGIVRLALVRQGELCITARRVGNEIAIEAIADTAPALSVATTALLRVLPFSAAAQFTPVGAPLDAASHALSDTHDAMELSDRIRALGADSRTAMQLGSAFASRLAFAEIVYYTLDTDAERISRGPAAVGVFYTKRGRIVSAPTASPQGELWTTLKPGSDHAIKQAVGQLVELSAEGWEEI